MFGPLVGGLFPEQSHHANPGIYINTFDRLLTAVTIRQLRAETYDCNIPSEVERGFNGGRENKSVCYRTWSPATEDKNAFGPDLVFKYTEPEISYGTFLGFSNLLYREDGGFVTHLDITNQTATIERLTFLKDNAWIDDATSIVIVEFTVFNSNMNR